jgi:hypothetical protein
LRAILHERYLDRLSAERDYTGVHGSALATRLFKAAARYRIEADPAAGPAVPLWTRKA